MTPEQCRSAHLRFMDGVGETVTIRRYTGTGTTRPKFDCDVRARVVEYDPKELVGSIVQGDRKLIVLYEDLVAAQFPLPIEKGANWKVVVRGKELQIKSIDDNTRRIQGELIAYEMQAGG